MSGSLSDFNEESQEVATEYQTSLSDLINCSKPIITVLTMLADEGRDHAPAITFIISEHAHTVSHFVMNLCARLVIGA